MTMPNEEMSLAVVATLINELKSDVQDLCQQMRDMSAMYVSRAEWDLYRAQAGLEVRQLREAKDADIRQLREEMQQARKTSAVGLAQVREDMRAKHHPWTSVVPAITAILAIGVSAFTLIITLT